MYAPAEIGRTATIALGTLVLSTAALAFATAPARASTLSPVGGWQQSVNRQIENTVEAPSLVNGLDEPKAVVVEVRFDDQGRFADASIKRSSGYKAIDAEALRTARTVNYPPLPADATRRPVEMQLFFGRNADLAAMNVRQEQQLAQR